MEPAPSAADAGLLWPTELAARCEAAARVASESAVEVTPSATAPNLSRVRLPVAVWLLHADCGLAAEVAKSSGPAGDVHCGSAGLGLPLAGGEAETLAPMTAPPMGIPFSTPRGPSNSCWRLNLAPLWSSKDTSPLALPLTPDELPSAGLLATPPRLPQPAAEQDAEESSSKLLCRGAEVQANTSAN